MFFSRSWTARPGAPITSFAVESLLDDLARKLDMDPLTLREKNAARNGSKTHYGPSPQNIGFETLLRAVKSHPHWMSAVNPGHGPRRRDAGPAPRIP